MSLVTRFSIAFLVALALALSGFSACLYYLAGLHCGSLWTRSWRRRWPTAAVDRPERRAGVSGNPKQSLRPRPCVPCTR
jgi:hypothetical protein